MLIKWIRAQWWGRWSKSERMQQLGIRIAKTCGRYASQGSFALEDLAKARKFNMDKGAVKDLVFGGLMELQRNRAYYYYSGVGSNYSYWTEEGKEAVLEFMREMAPLMRQAEEVDLNKRAKEMVLKELKSS
jgi:hypothetical protein